MTANQVAAQGNAINERLGNAEIEVKEKQLTETERHNRAVEKNADEQLRITNENLELSKQQFEFDQSWKRDYEASFRMWQQANEEKRIEIEQHLADSQIWYRQQDAEYKDRIASNNEYLATLEAERVKLQSEFQELQKQKTWAEIGLTAWETAIRDKNVEYENANKHEQNLIQFGQNYWSHIDRQQSNQIVKDFNIAQMDYKWAELLWQREQFGTQMDYQKSLAGLQYGARNRELDISSAQLEAQRKLWQSQEFNNYMSGLFGKSGAIPSTLDVVKSFIPLGGAINGPKTYKQIAESLFSN